MSLAGVKFLRKTTLPTVDDDEEVTPMVCCLNPSISWPTRVGVFSDRTYPPYRLFIIGFFKGTSADQDRRFSDKELKLLKSLKFPPEFEKKVCWTLIPLRLWSRT